MGNSPRLVPATLVSREFRAPGFWFLRFRCEHVARNARPAQYVALDLPGGFAVRLPLGIYTTEDDTFSLLFREWGDRTSRLAALRKGDAISCIGPLGNEFTLPPPGATAALVAGGLGIAAFWMLAKELRAASIESTLVLGARSKPHIVGREDLARFGFPCAVCTDDGSEGFSGNVVERLRGLPRPSAIYGCGPRGMLKALCGFANEHGIPCQVSMEETFGCSLGTCWGCVVGVRRSSSQATGYPKAADERRDFDFARVCTDGTVFASHDLVWET
ncbi:MAG TPA: dihydroorotate dehydrogenase electron transfer subunit [Candidatus Acidoferrales bacterium]|nr:dihydroorotate dehydrogenase electron transfer subunit [Candidatus Acidoferrales bacterium]